MITYDEWKTYRQAPSLGIQYQQVPTHKALKVYEYKEDDEEVGE